MPIPHPDFPGVAVGVHFDPMPEHPAVAVEVTAWGELVHIPASIARDVAAAILAAME